MIHDGVFHNGFCAPTIKRKMRRMDYPKAESVRRDECIISGIEVSRREDVCAKCKVIT